MPLDNQPTPDQDREDWQHCADSAQSVADDLDSAIDDLTATVNEILGKETGHGPD